MNHHNLESITKGSQIYIEGKLQTRKWQTKDDQDRYTTEIVAGEMQTLGGKNGQAAPQNSQNDDDDTVIPFGDENWQYRHLER